MVESAPILSAKGGFLWQTFCEAGLTGCARKILTAIKMNAPVIFLRRRTNKSVAAYFDLITDDGRMFYGDNFHFGFFHEGAATLADALDAHTDLIAKMANLGMAGEILDIGAGVGAPAIRIAKTHEGHITGINISAEQVRQGRQLIARHGLSHRIDLCYGNALKLSFKEGTFDAALAIEVAGDICVTEGQKTQFVREIRRVLRPGGMIGFSDLVFRGRPGSAEERIMRMILYHEGKDLVTDWPELFRRQGFHIHEQCDMIDHTMETWTHSLAIYEKRREEVERRYGKRIAAHTMKCLKQIPEVMQKYGSFIVMSAEKV